MLKVIGNSSSNEVILKAPVWESNLSLASLRKQRKENLRRLCIYSWVVLVETAVPIFSKGTELA